jgi:hypothetical protein
MQEARSKLVSVVIAIAIVVAFLWAFEVVLKH